MRDVMLITINKSTFIIISICLFTYILGYSQGKTELHEGNYNFQFGASIKATVEFDLTRKSSNPQPILRLSSNVGVASVFLASWLYPSLNVEVAFYNGGLGSKNKNGILHSPFCFDAIAALTMTAGINNVLAEHNAELFMVRNSPLYYFGNFVHPALQNPFENSVSIGTDIIGTTDSHKKPQRVGFFNIHINRFQVSYFNDGGAPFSQIYLGDRNDRYYTGGIVFSLNSPVYTAFNSIEISYYKFTGYTKNAFEVSNKLNLAYTTIIRLFRVITTRVCGVLVYLILIKELIFR